MLSALTSVLLLILCLEGCVAQKRDGDITSICDPGPNDCTECYARLAYETITPQENQHNIQTAFFPPDTSDPVYVVVNYHFNGGTNKTFYWSKSVFFSLFYPLPVYQFSSLFFGDFEFRQRTLNLTLIEDCADVSDTNMQFLTQRLKLYAMERSIYPRITDDYVPKAESADTVRDYHSGNKRISQILLSAQIIIPILAAIFLSLLAVCYISSFFEKHNQKEEGNIATTEVEVNKLNTEGRVKVMATFIVSSFASLYSLILSAWALCKFCKQKKDFEQRKYVSEFDHQDDIIILMVATDALIFCGLLLVFFVCLVRLVRQRCNSRENYFWKYCAFSAVAPCTNLAVHSNHIVFAFIHNQEHALGVGIFYGFVLVINMLLLQYSGNFVYRYIILKKEDNFVFKFFKHIILKKEGVEEYDVKIELIFIFPTFIMISTFVWGIFVYLAAIYILIPINDAFEQAPARLRLVYDSFLVGFAALFAYKFIVKHKDYSKELYELKLEKKKLFQGLHSVV